MTNPDPLLAGLFPDATISLEVPAPPPPKKKKAPAKKKMRKLKMEKVVEEVNNLTIPWNSSKWPDVAKNGRKEDFVLGQEEARVELARWLRVKLESRMIGPSFREEVGPWRTLGDLIREACGDE